MSLEINATNFLNNAYLKAYYRFESGALTTDSSGEGHTLTAISDPAETTGVFGGGVLLDSTDAYSASVHNDFKPTGVFTVGAWMKTTNADGCVFASFKYVSSKYYGISFNTTAGNKMSLGSFRGLGTTQGTHWQEVLSSTSVCDNTWRFVVGVWDGSYLRMYVNGVADGDPVSWSYEPVYYSDSQVRVGCRYSESNGSFLTGSLDDVFLFNGVALSANEIKSLYLGLNFKSINGLDIISTKSINSVAIASVKTIN